jgi:Domain of unknown function (DUF4365)
MATQFPQRPKAHQLEDESIAFLAQHLPVGWTCDRLQHDYGVDLRVGLAAEGQINGQQLLVQIKACAQAPEGETVAITLYVPTLNLLRNMLDVALLVKYVASEREAYWLLLKDFTTLPSDGQKTVTVRVPRSNQVSADPWAQISRHVEAVHFRKLRANVIAA